MPVRENFCHSVSSGLWFHAVELFEALSSSVQAISEGHRLKLDITGVTNAES